MPASTPETPRMTEGDVAILKITEANASGLTAIDFDTAQRILATYYALAASQQEVERLVRLVAESEESERLALRNNETLRASLALAQRDVLTRLIADAGRMYWGPFDAIGFLTRWRDEHLSASPPPSHPHGETRNA